MTGAGDKKGKNKIAILYRYLGISYLGLNLFLLFWFCCFICLIFWLVD